MRSVALILLALALPACTTRNVNSQLDSSSPPGEAGSRFDGSPRRDSPMVKLEAGSRFDAPIGKKDAALPGACGPGTPCKATEYCSQASCEAAGQCKSRPTTCPGMYSPVCGCDNKTYGNECEAHSVGISVQYKGQCCSDLNQQYVKLIAAAKKCCALCTPPTSPCTTLINDKLDCPCTTSVNSSAPELSMLKSLAQQWTSQGCKVAGCPAVACPAVTGGTCQPAAGSAGQCVDHP
jgi:hypothetical protein